MNTITTSADFSRRTAAADQREVFPALPQKLFELFRRTGGIDSIDPALLKTHIVLE